MKKEEDFFNFEGYINDKKYNFQSTKNVFSKNEIDYINWYNHHNDTVFPIKEFCAHDTLLRNLIYNV